MRDKVLAGVDLLPLVDKLSTEERIHLANHALRIADQSATREQPAAASLDPGGRRRTAGLHAGAISASDDFDAPLADEFWLGAP